MKCLVLMGTAVHRGHSLVLTSVNNAGGDSHKRPLLTSSVNRYSHCWYLVLDLPESVRTEFKDPPSWLLPLERCKIRCGSGKKSWRDWRQEMRRRCEVCGREIKPFAEFWLREPDQYDNEGVSIKQGSTMPFCSHGCIFGWSGKELRKQKRESENVK